MRGFVLPINVSTASIDTIRITKLFILQNLFYTDTERPQRKAHNTKNVPLLMWD